MTIEEAMYCMKSYLPDGYIDCKHCPYYGTVPDGQVELCKSSEAHLMAIRSLEAWEKIKQEIMEYCKIGVMDGDIISTELCAIIDEYLQKI